MRSSDWYVRGIRLVSIPDHAHEQRPEEAIVPDILPSFLFVLLPRRDAPEPARGRVVVVFVRARGRLPGLRRAGEGRSERDDGRGVVKSVDDLPGAYGSARGAEGVHCACGMSDRSS